MGSCLACFREPATSALEANSAVAAHHGPGEEMPEARLHSAPSHVAPHTPDDRHRTTILTNGNHISAIVGDHDRHSHPRHHHHHHQPKQRAAAVAVARLGSTMGLGESRPADGRLNALFDAYRERDEDAIRVDGIVALCRDLQVAPDDFRVLVLAHKLNAAQMCRFTRAEFVGGLRAMAVDSVRGVRERLPELAREVETSPELFKDLYRFTFNFGLDVGAGQRSLLTEMAVDLWNLVFTVRRPPILGRWIKFLERHPSVKGIPRDTWNMFLNFAETVGDDLSSYDDNEAWPSLFDDFVEYENDQANQNISKDKEIEARD